MFLPEKTNYFTRTRFWWLLLAAIVVRQIPFISLPFNWLESYFHEISHGLMAIVTGGRVLQIELFANGAGLCTSQGGSRLLISFAGYAGAILWGSLIYRAADAHQQFAKVVNYSLLLLLAVTIVLWVRDGLTLLICLIVAAVILLAQTAKLAKYTQLLMQLMGLVVLLNALHSPLYLLDGSALGDGATLASITFVPEFIWVLIWVAFAAINLYWLGKKS